MFQLIPQNKRASEEASHLNYSVKFYLLKKPSTVKNYMLYTVFPR